jgi:short subunit fatty acids transporter
MHLISIEFQNIDNNPATPTKITFSSPSIVIILQSVQSLWLEFFLQTTGIYKILQLEVEKCNFIFIFILHASNGPQILGINLRTEVILIQCQKNMSKNNKKEKKRNEEEVHLH